MNKVTRKLIPAIFMLVIALVFSSTASYAWFSMNTTVTASGMQIKATTDANLYIAKGASVAIASVTGTSVEDLTVSNMSVKPADLSDTEGTVTVREAATYTTDPSVSSAGKADTWTDLGTLTATTSANTSPYDLNNYCAYAFVTIARKQTVASTFKLSTTCKITFAEASALNKSMRAGIIINGVLYESDDAGIDTAGSATFAFADITGLNDNTAYSACLIIWFEGEDADCYVNNAISLSNNTAEWTFTSTGA